MGAGEGVAQGGNTPKSWAHEVPKREEELAMTDAVLCLPVGVTVEQIAARRLQLATESRSIPDGI